MKLRLRRVPNPPPPPPPPSSVVIRRVEVYDEEGRKVYTHYDWVRLQAGDTYTFTLKVDATN